MLLSCPPESSRFSAPREEIIGDIFSALCVSILPELPFCPYRHEVIDMDVDAFGDGIRVPSTIRMMLEIPNLQGISS